jgi:hypothetical protein
MGGSFAPVWVAAFTWNGWQASAEYAGQRHPAAITLGQRIKRGFNIYIAICRTCDGKIKVNASIDDPVVIERILKHLEKKDASTEFPWLPHCWARRM